MTYRRNIQSDESIPLPLETTFNSSIDGVIDDVYTNRLRFKYPPEWITSNVNEKIIGIRNIHLKRKRKTLNFILYVRKYKKDVFDNGFNDTVVDYMIQLLDELLDDLPDVFYYYVRDVETKLKAELDEASRSKYNTTFYRLNRNQRLDIMKSTLKYDNIVTFMSYVLSSKEIDDIIDELNNSDGIENRIEIRLSSMNPNDVMVYRIPIQITIDESDTWNDIHNKIIQCVSKTNLYNYIRSVIISKHREDVDTLDTKLTQLNSIRDDYDLMLSQCSILIDYSVPFYLTNDDIGIFNYDYKRMKQLVIENRSDVLENDKYYYDYLITPNNNDSYNNAYQWPDNQQKPDYGYPYLFNSEVSFNKKCFIHDQDTRNFLNIGPDKNQNHIEYISKYHRNLYFHSVRTDLDCRIAASFANQSNHNIIGKTNETFETIKYYKINDNGDTFWIECYDNDDISIPINFNDDVVLTMDVVFLQNRKLLYS